MLFTHQSRSECSPFSCWTNPADVPARAGDLSWEFILKYSPSILILGQTTRPIREGKCVCAWGHMQRYNFHHHHSQSCLQHLMCSVLQHEVICPDGRVSLQYDITGYAYSWFCHYFHFSSKIKVPQLYAFHSLDNMVDGWSLSSCHHFSGLTEQEICVLLSTNQIHIKTPY